MKIIKEEYNNKLIDFLKENKNLIIKNDFKELYSKIYKTSYHPSELTQILLDASINPLSYIDTIYTKMYENLDIESILIPDNITEIQFAAFAHCRKLTNIILSSSLQFLDRCVFWDCWSLNTITIPKNLKKLYKDMFTGCLNLSNIIYEGSEEEWDQIENSDLYSHYNIKYLNK